MIFPWDSEIHQCIMCKDISFYDFFDISTCDRVSATWITSEGKDTGRCRYEFDVLAEDEIAHFNPPSFQDLLTVARSFMDYFQ